MLEKIMSKYIELEKRNKEFYSTKKYKILSKISESVLALGLLGMFFSFFLIGSSGLFVLTWTTTILMCFVSYFYIENKILSDKYSNLIWQEIIELFQNNKEKIIRDLEIYIEKENVFNKKIEEIFEELKKKIRDSQDDLLNEDTDNIMKDIISFTQDIKKMKEGSFINQKWKSEKTIKDLIKVKI